MRVVEQGADKPYKGQAEESEHCVAAGHDCRDGMVPEMGGLSAPIR